MTTLTELRDFVETKKSENPFCAEQIEDLYALAVMEVEEGGSMIHEIDLCINSIDELIQDEEL